MTEAGHEDDDDPFYKYDDYGNPLDADSIARRAVLRQWKRMSPDEFFAHLVSLGLYQPDGTLAEPYRDNGEPSKYRPTD